MPLRGYPDGIAGGFPNQYGNVGNTGSTGSIGHGFGFAAALTKIVNDGPGPIYLDLRTTSGATTGGSNLYQLNTGDLLTDFYDVGVTIIGLSYATTSTANNTRLGAWG